MLISQAKPAPQYVKIPAAALEALFNTPLRENRIIGKGHTETLLRMARYLWGDVVLDGSRADFAAALGLDPQTFEKHCPELARAGCWHYLQPQHGYYRFLGFVQTDEEAAALREAWSEALAWAAEQGRLHGKHISAPLLTARVEELVDASKLTFPVVVSSLSSSLENSLSGEKKQQEKKVVASKLTQCTADESILTLSSADESKLTRSLPPEKNVLAVIELSDELLDFLDQLAWIGDLTPVQRAWAESEERVLGWARYCLSEQRTGKVRNPGSLFRQAITGVTWPPQDFLSPPEIPLASEHPELAAWFFHQDEAEIVPGYARHQEAHELWKKVLNELELQMMQATYNTWLRDTRGIGYEEAGSTLVVEVKNSLGIEWLTNRLLPIINRTLTRITGEAVPIQFINL